LLKRVRRVAVEYRWTSFRHGQLAPIMAELVQRLAVIVRNTPPAIGAAHWKRNDWALFIALYRSAARVAVMGR
jgi:hypothetical protein